MLRMIIGVLALITCSVSVCAQVDCWRSVPCSAPALNTFHDRTGRCWERGVDGQWIHCKKQKSDARTCTPETLLEALKLADNEFVHDPNEPLNPYNAIFSLPIHTIDLRTPAERLRAEAEEKATGLERKSAAAKRIRQVLADCGAKP